MRIVIDLQGAQTESRFRGIGRYSLSLAKAIARNADEHEIWLALNGAFKESVLSLRDEFRDLIPQERIRVFEVPLPVAEHDPANSNRARVAELIREYFLEQLNPDVVLLTSLFEGFLDDAVTSVGRFAKSYKTATILYDLIPYMDEERYLPSSIQKEYYHKKIDSLKKADMLLSISEASKKECESVLHIPSQKITNISTAVDETFSPVNLSTDEKDALFAKYGITKKMVMYAPGGFDIRKNFENLIIAYSKLPQHLRDTHQLVIVSKVDEGNRQNLENIAKKAGLAKDELIITGYVSDEELIAFYSICTLFVFPSLHEGFGLPVLEAMACGAPVIGSNTTSVPEVIGLEKALFDPKSVDSISDKIREALENEIFLEELKTHSLVQSKVFSWDESAKKSIKLIEKNYEPIQKVNISNRYGDLIVDISHYLANEEESAIQNYAYCIQTNIYNSIKRQLFVDISEFIQRDSATGVQRVVRAYLKELIDNPPKDFSVEPVYATQEHGYRYANNYKANYFGTSKDVKQDEPIRYQRGDIFFALDMQHHVQLKHQEFFVEMKNDGVNVFFLVHDLLPIELKDFFKDTDAKVLHEQLLRMIASLSGAVSVSKATKDSYEQWLHSENIPINKPFFLDFIHNGADIDASLPSKGITEKENELLKQLANEITFLSVGTLEPRKAQEQIVDAFDILWRNGNENNLVIVGKRGWKTELFIDKIENHPLLNKKLFWLEGINDEFLDKIYKQSSCLIQASINEGFGLPLIEAAQMKIPLIARDIPVFREVAEEFAYYFKGVKAQDLASSIQKWLELFEKNEHPKSDNMPFNTWGESAIKLKNLLTQKYYTDKKLFVDITQLRMVDYGTGIQRVVKAIISEVLKNKIDGFNIELVYIENFNGVWQYKRALDFEKKYFDLETVEENYVVEPKNSDIFLGLDLISWIVDAEHQGLFSKWRCRGVEIIFVVYDILPVNHPQWWPENVSNIHTAWLKTIAQVSDKLISISEAVSDDVEIWISKNSVKTPRNIKYDYFHLGADIENSNPSKGLPEEAVATINTIKKSLSFIMVGTIEPRKGHKQTLLAFEQLWDSGEDVLLVIVGKLGWMMDDFASKVRNHPERNKRLFWLEGISDEYLEKVYEALTCLIAASEGEGFGLPLIEAAQHKKPIIARDIPVFREVAGEFAYYFENSNDSVVLEKVIVEWLKMYQNGKHPKSDEMPWLTWEESSKQLMEKIVHE